MEERTTLQPNQLEQSPATIDYKTPTSQPSIPPSSVGDESDDDGEFEFPFVSRDSPAGTAAPADELFADGRIRPFYPAVVFGRGDFHGGSGGGTAAHQQQPAVAAPADPPRRVRGQLGRLFLEESLSRDASVSSESDDDGGLGLEGAPPESYCLWTPGSSTSSPRPPPSRKRSGSTGSSVARWRRISDLVVGRSRSDGKDKFMFFPAPLPLPPRRNKEQEASKAPVHKRPSTGTASRGSRTTKPPAAEVVDTHRMAAYGTPRRTFLPYREELVAFFANVNGVSRSHHLTF